MRSSTFASAWIGAWLVMVCAGATACVQTLEDSADSEIGEVHQPLSPGQHRSVTSRAMQWSLTSDKAQARERIANYDPEVQALIQYGKSNGYVAPDRGDSIQDWVNFPDSHYNLPEGDPLRTTESTYCAHWASCPSAVPSRMGRAWNSAMAEIETYRLTRTSDPASAAMAKTRVMRFLGTLLHTIEDFYEHTNWVVEFDSSASVHVSPGFAFTYSSPTGSWSGSWDPPSGWLIVTDSWVPPPRTCDSRDICQIEPSKRSCPKLFPNCPTDPPCPTYEECNARNVLVQEKARREVVRILTLFVESIRSRYASSEELLDELGFNYRCPEGYAVDGCGVCVAKQCSGIFRCTQGSQDISRGTCSSTCACSAVVPRTVSPAALRSVID